MFNYKKTRETGGANPFKGDYFPSRMKLVGFGRPSLPFPHFWNYKSPIKILETYFYDTDSLSGSLKHNRYMSILGAYRILVSRDPKVIKAILSSTGDKPGQFDRDTRPSSGIARATGEDSLLYANGEVWRRQKKLSAPPLSRSNLFQPEKFHGFEQTFRNTVTQRLDALRILLKSQDRSQYQVALEVEVQVVMLEMLINNFFGAEVEYEEIRERYAPSIMNLIDYMIYDTVAPITTKCRNFLVGEALSIKKARSDFENLTDIALSGRESGRGLWAQFKSDASNEMLRSNIRVFLAGALEATTSLAGWALSHLSYKPEMQEEIYKEVKNMEVYDPDNLTQAVNLNLAIQETLRLTPSLYFLPRWASQDIEVKLPESKKLIVPKNTHILLDVWHSNRCEEFWGEAVSGYPANEFFPQRWEVLKKKGYSPKDMLHFGFGHGPRVCPGKFLGMLEVGLVVGAFIKIFKFSAVNKKTQVKAGVSTKPADGVLVNIEFRD